MMIGARPFADRQLIQIFRQLRHALRIVRGVQYQGAPVDRYPLPAARPIDAPECLSRDNRKPLR